MRLSISILTSLAFVLFATSRALSQNWKQAGDTKEKNIQTILEIFKLIEERDPQRPNVARQLELVDLNVEFHWPASLPYGGSTRGLQPVADRPNWGETWTPLQPTKAERRMDPRVVAANDHEVVVLYRQRGVSRSGNRYDGEVLGLYEVHSAKLTRAQMFYFDEAGAARFLAQAKAEEARAK